MATADLYCLWLEAGISSCTAGVCPMGVECASGNVTWILNAHRPPADVRKDFHGIFKAKEGESLRRFLGPRVSDYGRHTTPSAAASQGLHQTDPHPTGLFTAKKQHALALSATQLKHR